MSFDLQLRKFAADKMNEGLDMEAALEAAKNDVETRTVHFLNVVSVGINSAECRACSAPGLCDRIRAKPQPADRSTATERAPPSDKAAKAKAKKLRKKAREAELKEAGRRAAASGPGGKRKVLALQNGGVGDSSRSSGPGVVKKSTGKGSSTKSGKKSARGSARPKAPKAS